MSYIVGYGVYIPKYRVTSEEIANVWGRDPARIKQGLLISEKSVPALDEDSVTMSVEAATNALERAQIDPQQIGAIYSGSESPAYAVKPNATIVGNALGVGPHYTGADVEFACKAGTAALQMVMGLVDAKQIKYGLAIGADTAESHVEGIMDHGMGAGSGAIVVSNQKNNAIARIIDTTSYSTDSPDFWRRPQQRYPIHAERFTGEPAYMKHTLAATMALLEKTQTNVSEIAHAAFHTPNGKFPLKAGKLLGFSKEQLQAGFVVDKIANSYSASPLIGLSTILDVAKPGEKILITSFGSGAGSDSFLIEVLDGIELKRDLAPVTNDYITAKQIIDYTTYCKFTERIA